ncbi:MAG: radical SAM protein, partial [Clostridia bacterium]|nr:radical SAM protein [Clostridia bacterium]
EQAAEMALKYKNYWGTRGGVTVTGGEPLAQIDFVTELFAILKGKKIHCCVDTSGATFNRDNAECVKKHKILVDKTDLFLLDIKHIDDGACKDLTGLSNKNTLDFARFLSDNGNDMWIRYVLVPNINDDAATLERSAEFINSLKTVKKVEVLPYHTMGVVKYKNLGIPYRLEGTPVPSAESVANAKKILGA